MSASLALCAAWAFGYCHGSMLVGDKPAPFGRALESLDLGAWTMRVEHKTVKTTCPRDCYDACGMKVIVEDGRVRKVSGDRSHIVSRGKLCPKCALPYN